MNMDEIERLIAEDMLYQYHMHIIYDNLGIPEKFEINLLKITARLMGIKLNQIPDTWVDLYMEYMKKGKGLYKTKRIELAKECCERLVE